MPITRWSIVIGAGDSTSPNAREALETLCQSYWYPLYAYLRRQGRAEHEAKDLIQDFFLVLIEKKRLKAADPKRGRFRSFLLKSLSNHAADRRDRELALKRGGGNVSSLDALMEQAEVRYQLEPKEELDPARLYERAWTSELIQQTFARLRAASIQSGVGKRFEVLERLLPGKDPAFSQADAAKELGLTEGAVGKAVYDLRQNFARLFRETVAQTVATYEDLEEELQAHMNAFSP